MKIYKIDDYSNFIICIHSLKSYDANEVLNKINDKIKNNEDLTRKDLMMLSLVCFMRNTDIKQTILNSAETITKIQCLKDDMVGFIRGVLLIADKFIDDEKLNKKIIKMVVGNEITRQIYRRRNRRTYGKTFGRKGGRKIRRTFGRNGGRTINGK